MLKDMGSILRPFHCEGENVSKAAGEVRISTTRGTAARISGVTWVSMRFMYSARASSTEVSMKFRMSGPKAKGSGVSISSGHTSIGLAQASRTRSIGKSLRVPITVHKCSTESLVGNEPYLAE